MGAQRKVDLGFTNGDFPEGTHICQIYTSDDERAEALLGFLLAGLKAREKVACFSEKLQRGRLAESFEQAGIDMEASLATGELALSGAREVYFADEHFSPERMLQQLTAFHDASREEGLEGARVMGEMTPEIGWREGGSRLLEYECRVSLLLRERPITAVCQYEAGAFSGAAIMDVLKVHPMMVVRGTVVHNPFYIPPELFLLP